MEKSLWQEIPVSNFGTQTLFVERKKHVYRFPEPQKIVSLKLEFFINFTRVLTLHLQ